MLKTRAARPLSKKQQEVLVWLAADPERRTVFKAEVGWLLVIGSRSVGIVSATPVNGLVKRGLIARKTQTGRYAYPLGR